MGAGGSKLQPGQIHHLEAGVSTAEGTRDPGEGRDEPLVCTHGSHMDGAAAPSSSPEGRSIFFYSILTCSFSSKDVTVQCIKEK